MIHDYVNCPKHIMEYAPGCYASQRARLYAVVLSEGGTIHLAKKLRATDMAYDYEDNLHDLRESVRYCITHPDIVFLENFDDAIEQSHDQKYKRITWQGHRKAKPFHFFDETEKLSWNITEITTYDSLKKEGKSLKHCVADYVSKCVEGETSIWSLECNAIKCLTIEVKGKSIEQVRGKDNRHPHSYEIDIVKKWAKREQLDISKDAFFC